MRYDDDDYEERFPERRGSYEVRRVSIMGGPMRPSMHRPPGDKFTFTSTEIQHLAIAYIVLTICFAIVFSTGLGGILFGIYINRLIYFALPVSLVAVGLGFILHEIAHKFTAQHFGCWSEFRYDQGGLLRALFFSALIGIVYAAPGATWVSGHVTRRENGIISLAGPAINMAIALILIPVAFLTVSNYGLMNSITFIGFIIAFLGVFNLIPFGPLDGKKVWAWDKLVYIISMGSSIALLVFWGLGIYTTLIFP